MEPRNAGTPGLLELPNELLFMIADNLNLKNVQKSDDIKTFHGLLLVSQRFNIVFTPKLYRSQVLKSGSNTSRRLFHAAVKAGNVTAATHLYSETNAAIAAGAITGPPIVLNSWAGMIALYDACLAGSASIVAFLFREGLQPNPRSSELRTLFHKLARSGTHAELLSFLLARGVPLNSRDRAGRNALHLAVLHGHQHMAQVLLEHGGELNVRDSRGATPLLDALPHGAALVGTLLAHGADVAASVRRTGSSALHAAAKHGREHIMRVLLAHRAAVDARDALGRTPLMMAARAGHLGAVHILRESGADVSAPARDGASPLHVALHSRKADLAWLLLDAGAKLEHSDGLGDLPVHVAVAKKLAPKLVQKVVELTPKMKLAAKNRAGKTPLHLAVLGRNAGLVKMLLEAGANANIQDAEGLTPQDMAAKLLKSTRNDTKEIAEVLAIVQALMERTLPDSI